MTRLDTFVIVPLAGDPERFRGQVCAVCPIDTVGGFRLVTTGRRVTVPRALVEAAGWRLLGAA